MVSYYVYAYIRSKDSQTSKAGTPYYIGKGTGYRAWDHHRNVHVPKNKNFIAILENNLSELGAFALERRLILWWGRKDINTGVLLNRTAGGEGVSGYKYSEEQRKAMSERRSGKKLPDKHKQNISKSLLGKKKSKDHAANISKAQIGKQVSEQQRKKHSEKMAGRKLTEEHKKSISEGMKTSEKFKSKDHTESGQRLKQWSQDNREELDQKIKEGWENQSPGRKEEISKKCFRKKKAILAKRVPRRQRKKKRS